MADMIVKTTVLKKPTAPFAVEKYLVEYTLDVGEAEARPRQIVIDASEMTDVNDLAELKILANAKALVAKNALIASLTVMCTKTNDTTNDGDVTL